MPVWVVKICVMTRKTIGWKWCWTYGLASYGWWSTQLAGRCGSALRWIRTQTRKWDTRSTEGVAHDGFRIPFRDVRASVFLEAGP